MAGYKVSRILKDTTGFCASLSGYRASNPDFTVLLGPNQHGQLLFIYPISHKNFGISGKAALKRAFCVEFSLLPLQIIDIYVVNKVIP